MKISVSKAKGFTLVELLVVIAIIAALAALATPVIMRQLLKAKLLTAKNICVALESAVDRFEDEYSYLPYDGDTQPETDTQVRTDSGVMAVLAGVENTQNIKRIQYFKLDAPKGGTANPKDGMLIEGSTAKLYDAWGKPYFMIFDYDLDGEIDNPFKSDEKVRKKVLVFSSGPDYQGDDIPDSTATPSDLVKIPRNF